jgi:hypothetical protein
VQYELNVQPDANWQLSNNNTVVTQTDQRRRLDPARDFNLINEHIEGTQHPTPATTTSWGLSSATRTVVITTCSTGRGAIRRNLASSPSARMSVKVVSADTR